MKQLIGNAPDQVSRNKDLGGLAFQEETNPVLKYVISKNLYIDSMTITSLLKNDTYPNIKPSLRVDVHKAKQLDFRFTTNRDYAATYVDFGGVVRTSRPNQERVVDIGTGGGLLVESSATNYLTYSNDFSNAVWVKGVSTTLTPSYATGADAVSLSASRLVMTSGGGTFMEYDVTGLIAGQRYTFSVWARSTAVASSSALSLHAIADGNTTSTYITADGVWRRYSVSFISGSTTNIVQFGNDTSTTSVAIDVLIWGAQLEYGDFATSYIPTTDSSVVRPADIISTPTSDWFLSTEGTFVVDFYGNSYAGNVMSVSDSTGNNSLSVVISSNYNYYTGIEIKTPTIGAVELVPGGKQKYTPDDGYPRIAFSYKVTGTEAAFSVCCNGSENLNNVLEMPTGLTKMILGCSGAETNFPNTNIKRIMYFPKQVTDSELQELSRK